MKTRNIILVTVIAVILLSLISECASPGYETVKLNFNGSMVELNDKCLIINDSTMVPMKEICSYIGMDVSWDEETMTATGRSAADTLKVTKDSNVFNLNGVDYTSAVPAVTVNERMYIPLRSVAEALGYEVDYSGAYKTAYIFSAPRAVLQAPQINVTTQVLSEEDKLWLDSTLTHATAKVAKTAGRVKDTVAYSTQNGLYSNKGAEKTNWWTNGFYPGILWIMYENTLDPSYAEYAKSLENRLAQGLNDKQSLDHDLGFLWMLSGYRSYSLMQDEVSKANVLKAAEELYGRYNRTGKFIVAWNGESNRNKSIIDTMMNLDLLYTATNLTRNPVYANAASNHADTTIRNFVRPDGSCQHQVVMNPANGEYVQHFAGQGYDDGSGEGSHWARGTAWALNGFAKCFGYTGNIKYLETSEKIAVYFESKLRNGYDVPMDFNQPSYKNLVDTSAGAIAASGLIDLARHTDDPRYLNTAIGILKNLTEKYGGDNGDEALLTNGCVTYSNPEQQALIYGDYYYLEALMKLKDFAY